jgi:hypothetical protein
MKWVENIIGKISFIWKGNSKKIFSPKKGKMQLQQGQNSIANIFNIENVSVSQIKELTSIDKLHDKEDILTSMGKRFILEQTTKQKNLASIVEKSSLNKITSPNDLDKDWFFKWMSTAEEVSRETLQDILAKILSDEIQKPGSFSFQTLDTIKYLSRQNLEKFQKFVALSNKDGFFHLDGISKSEIMEKYGVSFTDYVRLSDLGLFNQSSLSVTFNIKNDLPAIINIGKEEFIISLEGKSRELRIGCLVFSIAGQEIYSLLLDKAGNEKLEKYKEDFVKYIEKNGLKIEKIDINYSKK